MATLCTTWYIAMCKVTHKVTHKVLIDKSSAKVGRAGRNIKNDSQSVVQKLIHREWQNIIHREWKSNIVKVLT